ncbi:MAG: hypothetical protein IJ716_11815 [Lachnospiraceae bacterium]|nr:hypothetical protein [Lachnospiraceae bacterium]
MLKMLINFDEERIKKEYDVDIEEIYDFIEEVVLDENLFVDKKGIYINKGEDEEDIFSFMIVASILADRDWIIFAKEWLWYEGSDEAENLLDTFKIRQ